MPNQHEELDVRNLFEYFPQRVVMPQAVEGLEEHSLSSLERALAAALDPRKLTQTTGGGLMGGPGGAHSAGTPTPGSSAKWQVHDS